MLVRKDVTLDRLSFELQTGRSTWCTTTKLMHGGGPPSEGLWAAKFLLLCLFVALNLSATL